jgi:hypothetical protein
MANFWQNNDNENRRFWDWFFRIEEISEQPLHDDEAIVITKKNANGESQTYSGIRLKKTLSPQKKRN